jgi:serine/threonine protein phosphatase PrpC
MRGRGSVASASHPTRVVLSSATRWAATPLGDIDSWPENLRLAVRPRLTRLDRRPTLLILYTDGPIERRGETLDDTLDRLAKTATACSTESVQTIADHLITQMVDDSSVDDVALVVKRVHPYPSEPAA